MESWPSPYQTLVGDEITRAEQMVADDSWKFQWFKANLDYTCRCKFLKTHNLHFYQIPDMQQKLDFSGKVE